MSTKETTEGPVCVGIIMDGNRRWAKERDLPTLEGHKKGYEKLKEAIEWCKATSIRHLVVYAFSTENWNRSPEEVAYLMDLTRNVAGELNRTKEEDAAVHFVGDLSRFPEDIQETMNETHDSNSTDAKHHLWVAASYGGRAELTRVVNNLAEKGPGPYSEEDVAAELTTAGMPDPDIVIRTGGQKRLSNFLPWQSTYSELFFLDTYWPALTQDEFQGVLTQYNNRLRNFGK